MRLYGITIALLAAVPHSLGASISARQSITLRATIHGDSITHGANGDWTWRYRLWQWMQADPAIEPQFVGPFTGTHLDNPNTEFDTGGNYHAGTDATFVASGSAHAAHWGRSLAQSAETVTQWTRDYQPDYLLVMLGFNDLGWFVSDVNGTLANMERFVTRARAVKPSVQFFIANIVDRSFLGGREDLVVNTKEYNQRLPGLLKSLDTASSSIRVVDVNTAYECRPEGCPDGYDGLHPNEHGEYNIARAFSLGLTQAGLGTAPLEVPHCASTMPYQCNYQT